MHMLLLALLTAALGSQLIPLGEPGTLNPVDVKSGSPGATPQISLARYGSDLAAAFSGARGQNTGIYWRRFSNDTQDWSETVQVSAETSRSAFHPFLTIDKKGNSHCIWLSRSKRGVYQVYYARLSKGDGQQWSEPHLLSVGGRANPPRLLEDASGNLLVYYWNLRAEAPNGRVYAFASADAGLTWRATDPNFSAQENPGAARAVQGVRLPGGGVGLVWTDDTPGGLSLVFNRTQDGGKSWLARPVVVPGTTGKPIERPQILVAGQTLHVGWTIGSARPGSGSQVEAWTSHSQDEGLSWSDARRVYQTAQGQIDLKLIQAGENVGWIGREKQPSRTQPPGPPGGRLIEVLYFKANHPLSEPVVKEIYASADHELSDLQVVPSAQRILVLVSETHPFQPSRILSFIREEGDFHKGPTIQASVPANEVRSPLADFDPQEKVFTILFHKMKWTAMFPPQSTPATLLWQRYRAASVK